VELVPPGPPTPPDTTQETGSAPGGEAAPVVPAPPPVAARSTAVPRWAWGVLLLLIAMQVLDSVDRWLLATVLRPISEELQIAESDAGWLSTVLLLAFAVACPFVGYLADRMRRPRLLAVGFALWSLATVGTGLASSFEQIEAARALVGVGGATSMVIGLTLLMDLFPVRLRGRVLAVFLVAMPLGAGMAMNLGSALARSTSWQTAFLLVGGPGLALAFLALLVPEPVRGLSEGIDIARLRLHEHFGPSQEDYIDQMVNSSFTYSVFGITFSSFALAGLVYWLPLFLTAVKGLARDQADFPLGATFLAAAFCGTAAGGWLADLCVRSKPKALFLVPGIGILGATIFVLIAIYGRGMAAICGGLFLAESMMFFIMAPSYAIIAAVVMPNMRGVACAVVLAAVHLLGDIWSPTLMGWMIDTFGQADSMSTGFGRALAAIGAVPVALPDQDPQNVTAGMLVVIPALLISGIVLLAGARHLPREMALMLAKLKALPSRRIRPQPDPKRHLA
jgi:MFS family permease